MGYNQVPTCGSNNAKTQKQCTWLEYVAAIKGLSRWEATSLYKNDACNSHAWSILDKNIVDAQHLLWLCKQNSVLFLHVYVCLQQAVDHKVHQHCAYLHGKGMWRGLGVELSHESEAASQQAKRWYMPNNNLLRYLESITITNPTLKHKDRREKKQVGQIWSWSLTLRLWQSCVPLGSHEKQKWTQDWSWTWVIKSLGIKLARKKRTYLYVANNVALWIVRLQDHLQQYVPPLTWWHR